MTKKPGSQRIRHMPSVRSALKPRGVVPQRRQRLRVQLVLEVVRADDQEAAFIAVRDIYQDAGVVGLANLTIALMDAISLERRELRALIPPGGAWDDRTLDSLVADLGLGDFYRPETIEVGDAYARQNSAQLLRSMAALMKNPVQLTEVVTDLMHEFGELCARAAPVYQKAQDMHNCAYADNTDGEGA